MQPEKVVRSTKALVVSVTGDRSRFTSRLTEAVVTWAIEAYYAG